MKKEKDVEVKVDNGEFSFPKTGLIILGIIAALMIFCIIMICIL